MKIYMRVLFVLTLTLLFSTQAYSAEDKDIALPVTTQESNISLDRFKLIIAPLTADELFVEADGWMKLLQDDTKKVYEKKLEIMDQKDEIKQSKDENSTEEVLESENTEKTDLINELVKLRAVKKEKEDKLNAILLEINERIGLDENGHESEKVTPYRRYMSSVNGLGEEVTDVSSLLKNVKVWIVSDDGGLLWVKNILIFIAILFFSMLLSRMVSRGVEKALDLSHSDSQLLNNFIVGSVKNLVVILGILMGLSILGVNMGPVLAVIGAAGFVVAFALQGTLSNFASGLMIMLYRPYDIGDVVDVAGVVGTVKSMSMVATSVMTADNRLMVIPNNTIWGGIITNVTHSDKRRVDLIFGIGYSDNIEKAQKVLEDVLSKHSLVLKDPEPNIQVHELGDSSVNFICRPWVLTEDYWTVYWEITRRVKLRFDEEGISIPFPQRDIHVITSVEEPTGKQKRAFTKKHAEEIDVNKMELGEDDV